MASLIQYDSLNAMPANNQPTAAQLEEANTQYNRAEIGDEQPIPPPFTYDNIWVAQYTRERVEKVEKPNSSYATELKQVMKD